MLWEAKMIVVYDRRWGTGSNFTDNFNLTLMENNAAVDSICSLNNPKISASWTASMARLVGKLEVWPVCSPWP
jgi:hypothetical protein